MTFYSSRYLLAFLTALFYFSDRACCSQGLALGRKHGIGTSPPPDLLQDGPWPDAINDHKDTLQELINIHHKCKRRRTGYSVLCMLSYTLSTSV